MAEHIFVVYAHFIAVKRGGRLFEADPDLCNVALREEDWRGHPVTVTVSRGVAHTDWAVGKRFRLVPVEEDTDVGPRDEPRG